MISSIIGGSGQEILSTDGWHPGMWARELMRRDVQVVLTSGIDRFLLGVLMGHGIQVVPNLTGEQERVLEEWRSGDIPVPELWPPFAGGCRGRGRHRRRAGWR